MTGGRLAAFILLAAVCGAWLASAAGVTRQARLARSTPRQAEAPQFDALTADVQAQGGRLRERLAQAPAPRELQRNPFRFADRQPPASRRAARDAALLSVPAPVVPEIREPALQLIGVAENASKDGLVRTAMIAGGYSELMMVTAGQQILGRYDVVAVGADAVELKDLQTGAIRRLIMQ
jgi:hypothetical protein